ncbi:MAG: hypothetical protein K2X82_04455 [Gemmataceae bacterium]|nr:hypothetical protein [Gemmataceae bacterium]
MWTPRRVGLLLAGVVLFAGGYLVYSMFLGWLDGLPALPAKMLARRSGDFLPPTRVTTATEDRLVEAFGPGCPEAAPGPGYRTKLEFLNGESSVVLASSVPVFTPGSPRVVLAPFSLAVFGKPRPPHLRRPGEVIEITTFHADKAVFEYDRPVENVTEMGKAKLLRIELVSEPDPAVTAPDPRRGLVHVTHNQRSADPNQFMVVRTPGPLYYRDPRGVEAKPDAGPDVWTDAPVEITDRQNLPRPYGDPAPATAPAAGDDLRAAGAVPEILAGLRLPPPTITAVGLRLFLEPSAKPGDKPPAQTNKKGGGAFSGVRRVELSEKVLFHLWTDSRQGVVAAPTAAKGGPTPPPAQPAGPLAVADLPDAAAAVVGDGMLLAVRNARRLDRALLQIDTRGPFAFDAAGERANTARFDVVPQADPNLPNDVQLTRIPPRGGRQRLFSQVLEIEFDGPPTGPPADKPAAPKDPAKPPQAGPGFKRLHAFAYTPGRLLTLSSDDDRLEAYGQDLVHEQAVGRTTLRGAPLHIIRANEPRADDKPAGTNTLSAGGPNQPAVLVMVPGPGPDRATAVSVRGFGRLELFDPQSGAATTHASWQTSLTQTKEKVQGRELDVYTFTDAARFEDTKADYWLNGKVLQLWVSAPAKGAAGAEPGRPTPQRLQAVGEVTSHSAEFDIDGAELLTVLFRDAPPKPKEKDAAAPMGKPAPAVAPAAPPMATAPGAAPAPKDPPAKEPAKPKPPLKVRARTITTHVVRQPVPPSKPADGAATDAPAEAGSKHELEKAVCEGGVVVHQDPADPDKPRGVDIFGQKLILDHTPDGSVMEVTGTEQALGQVHQEGMSVLGPRVVIDQLRNRLTVEGRGSLVLPAGSDLAGRDNRPTGKPDPNAPPPKPPGEVVVHWRNGMEFTGADRRAEFVGRVRATQDESWVVCHTLQVEFDRPISFNQFRKAGPPPPSPAPPVGPAEDTKPKVERVSCWPAPGDSEDEPAGADTVAYGETLRDPKGVVVKAQHVTAKELVIAARATDPATREVYQQVFGHGPGTVRIWQPGEKDEAGREPAGGPRTPPVTPAKPAETEMKLTVVHFGGRMTIKDKGKAYQEAVFQDTVEVLHAPAADPNLSLEARRLPAGAVRLTCSDRLTVSTTRPPAPPARPGEKPQDPPPVQQDMVAVGDAYILSDDYDGRAETITSDGRYVTLDGSGTSLALIRKRFGGDETPGKKIVYDRRTKSFAVYGAAGGTYRDAAPPKKKLPVTSQQ